MGPCSQSDFSLVVAAADIGRPVGPLATDDGTGVCAGDDAEAGAYIAYAVSTPAATAAILEPGDISHSSFR
jgi:S1-C subfamily serine protease